MLQIEPIPVECLRPKQRHARRWLAVVLVLLAALAVAGLFIWRRGGKDYDGDLARLLPQNTACFFQLSNLEQSLNTLKNTSVYDLLTVYCSLSELLVDDEDLEDMREAGLPLDRANTDALVNRFFRRWFGRDVLCAILPLDNPRRPGFVALLRTQAGFEENLAELTANLWPNSKRESVEYEGIPLTLFRGDDPQEAIAYCRFGKTLAISFWEDSYEALKPLIDRRVERTEANLSQDRLFKQFEEMSKSDEGLSVFVQPKETFSLLETYEKLRFEKHRRSFGNFMFARDLLTPFEALAGQVRLENKGRELAASFQPLSRSDTAAHEAKSSPWSPLPTQPLAMVQGKSKNLQSTLLKWTFGFPPQAEVRQECDEWNKDFIKTFDLDMKKEVIPLVGDEALLALMDLKPGLVMPTVHLVAAIRLRDPQVMKNLLEEAWEHYQTRLAKGKSVEWEGLQRLPRAPKQSPVYQFPLDVPGYLAVTVHKDYLLIALPQESLETLKGPSETASTPHSDPSTIFSANLPALSNAIEAILAPLALWDKDIREDLAENQPLLGILKQTGTLVISKHGHAIEMVLPLDSRTPSR